MSYMAEIECKPKNNVLVNNAPIVFDVLSDSFSVRVQVHLIRILSKGKKFFIRFIVSRDPKIFRCSERPFEEE